MMFLLITFTIASLLFLSSVSNIHISSAADVPVAHGHYYSHNASEVMIREVGRHNGKVLGTAKTGELWTADCLATNGDSIKLPWDQSQTTTYWFSARDNAPRSQIKGYTGMPYMVADKNDSITLPSGFHIQNDDYCDFPGKAPLGPPVN